MPQGLSGLNPCECKFLCYIYCPSTYHQNWFSIIKTMKKLPEIRFTEKLLHPLKMEIVPFDALKKRYAQALDHNPYQAHQLKFNAIFFILDGAEGVHAIDFKNYHYEKNSVILVSKEQIHTFVDLPKSNNGLLLVFTEELFLEVGASFPLLINHLYNSQLYTPILKMEAEKFSELHFLVKKINKELGNNRKSISGEIAKSYLKILLLELFHLRENNNGLIENSPYLEDFIQFQKILRDNFYKEKKVKFYADKLNVSAKQLNKITQSTIKKSAKEFILSMLILEAKKYLKCSNLSSKELAYKLGFDEPTNFTKFFKKHTQMLPSEFVQRP